MKGEKGLEGLGGGRSGEVGLGGMSGLAVGSFVLGLLGLCLWIPALPGLILGVVSLIKIQGAKGQLTGAGLAIAGVVVSGVALVAAPVVLLPVANQVRERAYESKAMAEATKLRTALLNYLLEYRHFPVVNQEREEDIHTTSEGGVIEVLLGRSRQLNPRGIVFLADPGERLLDPWGNPYQILLDGDEDGRVTLRGGEEGRARTVESRVVVWSFGPNGEADVGGGGDDGDDLLVY